MKVLYKGISANGLGDQSIHCVIQAGPNSALSIISGVHRADYQYGLPDVRLGDTSNTPEGLVDAIKRRDKDFRILSVVPLRLLKPDEHPELEPHPFTKLRCLTCSCGEMQDDTYSTVASRIPDLLKWLADHEADLKPDSGSSRALSIAAMKADLRRWKTRVEVDPECLPRLRADPSPVKEPEEFVVCWFAKVKSYAPYTLGWPWPKTEKLEAVHVSCKPDSSHIVVMPFTNKEQPDAG